ncbi:MAG: dihydrolipoyl dehydrogenase [Gemmatimonadetes bacterium]|nr:dihydrolipoyl dehydrogenase [Gemmatimonadota bacterium]NNM06766.1 dihydrolipoyl dehydrogenase [Gemmatimonadota bacterium]
MSENGNKFDLIIIGSGPGGYVAAIRGAQLGLDVACVETEKLGGVCLNVGCIPTKALLSSALFVQETKRASGHGVMMESTSISLGPAQERSRKVADQLNKGVGHLFKKNEVTHLDGFGRLVGKGVVEVLGPGGEKATYEAPHVIIATGSRPRDLPMFPIDEDRIWSSTGALFQKEAPGSLAVVGAGAVGMEFADIYSAYGSEVHIIEMLDRVLPLEDKECSQAVARSYKKRKMKIRTSTSVQASEFTEQGVALSLQDQAGNGDTLEVDRVLSAVGRVPNTEDLGLENLGIALTEQGGFIQVDEYLRTNIDGIYAIGDVAGPPLLAHKASHEGIVCVEHIAGEGHGGVDYSNIPNCTYAHPEVASVGLTEEQALEAGHDIEVGKFPWVGIGRAVAAGDTEGFIKVIRDKQYSEILGAHIVGPHATELIAEFVLGRHLEATVEEMEKAMHPHPTLSEGVAEAALAALGRAIHI